MKGPAAERYRTTRSTLAQLLSENPYGVYVEATTHITGDLLSVSYRGATQEERLDSLKSPMPVGITSRKKLEEPETEKIVIYVGPPAKNVMPPTGFHFEGINDHLFDDAMKQIHESSNQRQRHSA